MDFGFSPEQDMLRQTARAFLADAGAPAAGRTAEASQR